MIICTSRRLRSYYRSTNTGPLKNVEHFYRSSETRSFECYTMANNSWNCTKCYESTSKHARFVPSNDRKNDILLRFEMAEK